MILLFKKNKYSITVMLYLCPEQQVSQPQNLYCERDLNTDFHNKSHLCLTYMYFCQFISCVTHYKQEQVFIVSITDILFNSFLC